VKTWTANDWKRAAQAPVFVLRAISLCAEHAETAYVQMLALYEAWNQPLTVAPSERADFANVEPQEVQTIVNGIVSRQTAELDTDKMDLDDLWRFQEAAKEQRERAELHASVTN
jgi:hypothetical protein